MLNREQLEQQLAKLPLYMYAYIDPKGLEFSGRIRYICQAECPMYGTTWACPPGVGEVTECERRCRGYRNCLLIGTIVEVDDIADIEAGLLGGSLDLIDVADQDGGEEGAGEQTGAGLEDAGIGALGKDDLLGVGLQLFDQRAKHMGSTSHVEHSFLILH